MPVAGRPTVYLHVGTFKSGTTYLQTLLWENKERLAADGVLVPGQEKADRGRAVRDIMGTRRWGERDPKTAGAWDRLVREVSQWSGSAAVISVESLSGASPEQVETIVTSLAPSPVHVILTARDLARVIPASWQTLTRNGHAFTWTEFVRAIGDPDARDKAPARNFWRKQDLPAILECWAQAVPVAQTCVVTVPRPGAAPTLLWERFASAAGLDPSRYDTDLPRVNESLGAASAELLRRLNPALREQVAWSVYQPVVNRFLGKSALADRKQEPRIAFDYRSNGWVSERAEHMVQHIATTGYPVTGDLDDLIPTEASVVEGVSPDEVSDADLLDAAMTAILGLVEQAGAAGQSGDDAGQGDEQDGQRGPRRRRPPAGAAGRQRAKGGRQTGKGRQTGEEDGNSRRQRGGRWLKGAVRPR
jgi:hypothetical protein